MKFLRNTNNIFTRKIQPANFLLGLITLVLFVFISSFSLFLTDYSNTNNDIIRKHQINKLENESLPVDIVILGDSSAGNGIDAGLLSELTGKSVINLSLTGSFGLVGSFEMMKRTLEVRPDVKNFVLVQSQSVWEMPFSKEGFFEINRGPISAEIGAEFFENSKAIDFIEYSTNLKRLKNVLRPLKSRLIEFGVAPGFLKVGLASIDPETDFLKQDNETIKNGLKEIGNKKLETINSANKEIYRIIDDYCGNKNLNCIYMHGPISREVVDRSGLQVKIINDVISNSNSIEAVDTIFAFDAEKMGDSVYHVSKENMEEITRLYYDKIENHFK